VTEMIEILRTKEVDGKIMLSKEDFEKLISEIESLIETIEILTDKNLMEQINESQKDIQTGNVVEVKSIEELRRQLFE
jgi:high-affinity Fe2+/Pb2+ permease